MVFRHTSMQWGTYLDKTHPYLPLNFQLHVDHPSLHWVSEGLLTPACCQYLRPCDLDREIMISRRCVLRSYASGRSGLIRGRTDFEFGNSARCGSEASEGVCSGVVSTVTVSSDGNGFKPRRCVRLRNAMLVVGIFALGR